MPDNKYVSITEAMERLNFRVSRPTIISWCRKYGIGHLIGGKYVIDFEMLNNLVQEGPCNEQEKTK